MRSAILSSITAVSLFAVSSFATIINIPDDYPTIQQGIDASTDGDTVLVQPGTYVENIYIYGHNIVLGSMFLITGDDSYISSTYIDGDSSGSVVRFLGDVDTTTIITGFTLQNGNAYFGGGIYCHDSNPKISYNIIRDNLAFGFEVPIVGGGIFCSSSNPRILNNTITGNVVIGSYGSSGGGICCEESSPIIVNNTINSNSADFGAGIFCTLNSNPDIVNTIIWGDYSSYNSEVDYDGSSSPFIIYCDIQGGWPGIGNIENDPLFRDPENGDLHLMSTACGDPYDSPCIDIGAPVIEDSLLACSRGLATILSDMGAYGGGVIIASCNDYVIGDFNCSGLFNIGDIVAAYRFLIYWEPIPPLICQCPPGTGNIWPIAMDLNNSCAFNIADIIDGYSKLKTSSPELIPCLECPPEGWEP
jgi:hypothetical protein